MSALAHLHFLRPLWLLALPVLLLTAWWWWRHRQRQSPWHRHVDAHLLPHLLEGGSGGAHTGFAPLAAMLLAVLALAGPSWRLGEQPLWRSRTPLVVAFDLSSAILASDLPPSRLLQARTKLATLLRERNGGPVGLVAFADDAFTVAPVTEDTGNIALFLDALAPEVMPVDGHRADRAIARCADLLRQAGFEHGDILLITDHAGDDAMRAAQAAARAGFQVSALRVGTAAGAPYRNADGAIMHARLDDAALSSLAHAGNGRYAALRLDDADLRALGLLSAPVADSVAMRGESGRSWRDEGYWLLPPLLLLGLFAFRRGAGVAALLLLVVLPWPQARAQAQGTLWQRADQVEHARMQAGEQAYRAGDYAGAAKQYTGMADADAHYNLGNALAKQGAYAQALRAYDQALRVQPGMADALANKRAVEAAMKRRPPAGRGQQQDRKQRGQQQSPSQAGQSASQAQSDSQGADGQPKGREAPRPPQPRPSQAGTSGTPQPPAKADAAAQRSADAAQRERMRRAMQGQQARTGAGRKTTATPGETPAQREQRLANEAWLRRVPDHPGGLLRAKFRLEYERRQQGGSE